jgi:hypothetical protein
MTIDAVVDLLAGLTPGRILLVVAVWIATMSLSTLIVAAVVVRLPPRYFCDDAKATPGAGRPASRVLGRIARNGLGLILVIAGLLLSLPGVPGQGVVTTLIGLLLIDFPGRRRLERALLRRPGVLPALNRLRARFGKPPLSPPGSP